MTREFATIITDAGLSNGRARWGGRVITHEGAQTYHGEVRSFVPSSNAAELIAVVNVVHAASRAHQLYRGMGWLIQTDNDHVVRLLNHHFQTRPKDKPFLPPHTAQMEDEAVEALRKIAEAAIPEFIYTRHVKGHVAYSARNAAQHVQQSIDNIVRFKPRKRA